jgi:type I restriction enzyme M protein
VPGTHRLLMMNLLLHGIEPDSVKGGDTLGPDGEGLGQADLILSNPPFGTKKGGSRPVRSDFTITADTSNKQLAFVEHIVRGLKPGGRAGIVLPDNVLFVDGAGRALREWMMEVADLHTILRLPTGIFYAQGVKTNVIFLCKSSSARGTTQGVWVWDMRAGQPAYGKTRPLRVEDFAEFEAAYGAEPDGTAPREDQGAEGRWRRFTRAEIAARAGNLDISWLRASDEAAENSLEEPDDILDAIRVHLAKAIAEIEGLAGELGGTPTMVEAAE